MAAALNIDPEIPRLMSGLRSSCFSRRFVCVAKKMTRGDNVGMFGAPISRQDIPFGKSELPEIPLIMLDEYSSYQML